MRYEPQKLRSIPSAAREPFDFVNVFGVGSTVTAQSNGEKQVRIAIFIYKGFVILKLVSVLLSVAIMPITPKYDWDQTVEEVHIRLHVVGRTVNDTHLDVNDAVFTFISHPYMLQLILYADIVPDLCKSRITTSEVCCVLAKVCKRLLQISRLFMGWDFVVNTERLKRIESLEAD
jgi:CS domain